MFDLRISAVGNPQPLDEFSGFIELAQSNEDLRFEKLRRPRDTILGLCLLQRAQSVVKHALVHIQFGHDDVSRSVVGKVLESAFAYGECAAEFSALAVGIGERRKHLGVRIVGENRQTLLYAFVQLRNAEHIALFRYSQARHPLRAPCGVIHLRQLLISTCPAYLLTCERGHLWGQRATDSLMAVWGSSHSRDRYRAPAMDILDIYAMILRSWLMPTKNKRSDTTRPTSTQRSIRGSTPSCPANRNI